jgi:probable rRNA maturation factor
VETILEDGRWEAEGLAHLADRAFAATLVEAGLDAGSYEAALLGCGDARISELNESFRGPGRPTNVLSWPSDVRSPGEVPGDAELGDVAISFDTCAREAEAQGKRFDHHVLHLVAHATLHLLGHDHVNDADADAMEAAERRICAALGVPDPYRESIS